MFNKKSLNKIKAEFERGIKIYQRYKAWLISDLISTPFWIIFFFFAIILYVQHFLKNETIIVNLLWGIFMFFFVSGFLWMGNSIVLVIQQGILENIILTNTSIHTHLLGRVVISFIDVTVGGIALLILGSYIFNVRIYIADPLFFIIFLLIAIVFFVFFASVYAALIAAMRSPWIVTNILQFILPFMSGALPIQMFNQSFANVIIFSPFYYIIGTVVSAATGYYIMDKYFLLFISLTMTIIMILISLYVEKILVKKALKHGKFSLF